MNDSSMTIVNKNAVSKVHPYMLFYIKKHQNEDLEERKTSRKQSLN